MGSVNDTPECQPIATKSIPFKDVEVDVDGPVDVDTDLQPNMSTTTSHTTASKFDPKIVAYGSTIQLSKNDKTLSALGVGTFSIDHEAVSRGISSGILNKRGKMRRCGSCKGCNATNCEKCINCRNMVKNGGPGNLKQACIERRCVNPQIPMPEGIQATHASKGPGGLERLTMAHLPQILPTTTAEMIKMDEVSTKYIKEVISTNTDFLPTDYPVNVPGNEEFTTEKDEGFQDVDSSIRNSNSLNVTLDDTGHVGSPNKGFFKMLRRAEQYVADLDPFDTTRPKLSYGAMCALAIQVI